MMSEKEAVVFLASGGLDSTVGMAKAIEDRDVIVFPLYIQRGAKADAMERAALSSVVFHLKESYPGNLMEPYYEYCFCPPRNWKGVYPDEDVLRRGYPMRDIVLQSVGVQYAEYLNALEGLSIRTVMVGQTSDEVLPHATPDALRLASFYTQLDRDDESWGIKSPLLWPEPMTKADVVRWGLQHEIPIELTWSCFHAGPEPCGHCQECERRNRAILEAGGK